MTLTSHAVAGAVAASFFPKNPVSAFIFGFLSHFVLDAIPHWHYPLRSHTRHPENPLAEDMPWGRRLFFDLLKISADFLIGFSLVFLLFKPLGQPINWVILLGAISGMTPDALQFVYWKIRKEPLISLQKFHIWMHAEKNFNSRPLFGIAIEFATMTAFFLLSVFFS